MFRRAWLLVLLLSLALFLPACKRPKTVEEQVPPSPPPAPQPAAPAEPVPPEAATEVTEGFPEAGVEREALEPEIRDASHVLQTVYFAFDSYELDETAREALRRNARWLLDNPGRKIIVEGHCDERGTLEYNLALGERRAAAVRDYLVSLGVDARRVRIVSYGEERPADPGHTEEAWSRNRRAEFRFEL